MSSIAYITDYKMLENHRLNQNNTMNFWRLSTKIKFASFGIGGLVFFLSKNREHQNSKREKGIIGFGRLTNIYEGSPLAMWNRFTKTNGYNSYEEFVSAIKKVSKDEELPKTMSSFYLENVCFFQNPIYLSEYNIDISKSVQSFVYIDDATTLKLLEYGKNNTDIWSSKDNQVTKINDEIIGVHLAIAHSCAKDIKMNSAKAKIIQNETKEFLDKNPVYRRIHGSFANLCNIYEENLTIIIYHNEETDMKEIVGQATMYRKYLDNVYDGRLSLLFKTIDNNEEFADLVN